MAPPPPSPVPLFPPAPTIQLTNDPKLQSALDAAITSVAIAGNPPPFGLTIVDIGSSSSDAKTFASAGFNQDTEHYVASMTKVICLYAAHALRELVQRFNTARKPADGQDLFKQLHQELDSRIDICCPLMIGRAAAVRRPRWEDVFAATGPKNALSVGFNPRFNTALGKMIIPSDNNEAGRCIRGVGYAYMNGLMSQHGLFGDSGGQKKGLWLAGDYGSSEVVTIPCDNDGDTKQGATSATMARLGMIIFLTSLPGSWEMVDMLKKSSTGSTGTHDTSYFTRHHWLTHDQVLLGKIGFGQLKSKRDVLSDLNLIVNPLGHGGSFMVCYTNVDQVTYGVGHVLKAFLETVRVYQSVSSTSAAAPAFTGTMGAATP